MQKFGSLYIDTDIIVSFGFNIYENPEWENLKKRIDHLKIKTFIPQIVLEELLINRREEFNRSLNDFNKVLRNINSKVTSKLKVQYSKEKLEKELEKNIHENFRKAKIEVFDIPFDKIDLRKLINMAINRIKPFKEKDKGFKDALILFSIIEHSKGIEAEEHLFLTGNKSDFDSDVIRDLIEKNYAEIKIFFSIKDLEKYLDNFINKEKIEFIHQRNERLKEFLFSNKEMIQNFIDNYPFSEFYLKRGASFLMERIERIEKIEILDILNPVVGFLEHKEEGDVKVEFEVKANFYIIFERFITKREQTILKVGSPSFKIAVPIPKIERVKIEKLLRVQGQIHIKRKKYRECFSNLRLHAIVGEEVEFSYLSRILLSSTP